MMKVMAFGTFDILHKGHEYYLNEAKKYGYLVVVVARDETVKRVKGRLPDKDEETRCSDVEALGIADEVMLGDKVDPLNIVEEIRPDVICLGYDQQAFTSDLKDQLGKRGINPKIVRIGSFHPEKYKSSKLRKQKK